MKEFSVETYDRLLSEEMSPIELMWVFLEGDTSPTHRYVLATRQVGFGGYAHTPLAWGRGSVSGSVGSALDKMDVRIDNVSLWFSQLATKRPIDGSRLKLIRIFRETWADPTSNVVIFDGRIQSMAFDGESVVVEVVSHMSFLNRPCPGRVYMPQCNYRFGSALCGVDLANYTSATLAGGCGSSTRVFVNAALTEKDNYWAFGYVEIQDGDYKGLRRPVGSSSLANHAVYLRYPFPVTLEGKNVKIVAGCHKNKEFCDGERDNLLNYGGFAEVPRRPLIPVSH